MTPHIKLYSLAFVTLASLCGNAAVAQVISLDSVIAAVERNNPMLQEFDSKVNALTIYKEGAKSWMAPMVGAGTFMTPYRSEPNMMESDKGAVMFSFEQQIPNPAKQNANKAFLSSRAAIEQQNKAIQLNKLRTEAKSNYYQWIVLEKKKDVLSENKRILELMAKLEKIRYPYNQGSLGNIYKAEGRIAEVDNMILMNTGEIEEKRSQLLSLMGVKGNTSLMVDTAQIVSFTPQRFTQDTTSLGTQRSDLKKIDRSIEAMKLNQQLQRAQAKPEFRIRFDHMQPLGDMPTQFTAMAMVSVPIAPWSSKMYRAEVKAMEFDIEAMEKQKEAILNETKGMLSGIQFKLRRMQQQLENYKTKIMPALQKNYQILMLNYEENREKLPMVIDGWEAMNMAQMEYLNKLEEYYLMITQYENQIEI